ncbi:cytochrome c-type biogenesis protein [Desulfolithobacter sp.]
MKKTLIPVLLLLALLGPVSDVHALTRSEVEKNLTCYACPGEPLNIDRCSGGDQMRAEIDRRMALGQDKETILNFFVQRFGEDILTVPPQKGFNLVAWAAPFVALFIGLVVAAICTWQWAAAGRRSGKTMAEQTEAEALYHDMEKRVEDELKKLEDDA